MVGACEREERLHSVTKSDRDVENDVHLVVVGRPCDEASDFQASGIDLVKRRCSDTMIERAAVGDVRSLT